MKLKIALLFGLVILWAGLLVLWLPPLSIHFIALPAIISLFSIMAFGIFAIPKANEEKWRWNFSRIFFMGLTTLSALYLVVALVGSMSIFNWKTQQQELLLSETVNFDTSVPNVDMNNLVILDRDDAERASEKLITEKDPALGSLYQMGEGTLQVVKDKPYWVFPLEHRGFFKWLSTKGNIPGYLVVSATNFNNATFVDKPYMVSPSGFLSDDLKRTLYTQFPNLGLTDFSFEIDDEANPHWVVTAYENATWLSTPRVLGSIDVDATTGKATFKAVGDQDPWVDRVYPVDFFETQVSWYGRFIKGWWNPSDSGKLQASDGIGYVFNQGKIYFYTGMTSVGKDQATTGFMIFDPRKGQATYHRISGSVEYKAMGLMEELVQNAGYMATFPYLINLNGEPTYFSTLKGNSGNVVGYAFASVQNYKAVAWATTLREAQTEYNRALLREGGSNSLDGQEQKLERVSGSVERVGALADGYYIVKLANSPVYYLVSSEQFPTIALTQVGDTIEIQHLFTPDATKIDAIDFTNPLFPQP